MEDQSERIAIKPYLKKIEGHCSQLSREELIQLVLSLAKDESTSERVSFLKRLKTLSSGSIDVETDPSYIKRLLADVDALKITILDRIQAIENGDYDELDDWEWEDSHYYDDDEPDIITDEHLGELSDIFIEAGSLFLDGEIHPARTLYQALFDVLDALEDYDVYRPELSNVDIREERARYARCVYETSDQNDRLKAFADAMKIGASFRFDEQKIDEDYPLLQDVVDAAGQDLKDIEAFYTQWEKYLWKRGTRGRPASLLVEVAFLTKGLKGVEALSRKWGTDQPYGYLFWLERLKMEEKWDDMIEVAEDALKVLDAGNAREKVSAYLSEAGQMVSNPSIMLKGLLEKFYSFPCDTNLKAVLAQAIKQDERQECLSQILDFYSRQKGMDDDETSLYLKTLLLAGDLESAWKIVEEFKGVGWSYGVATGLVFSSICVVAADYHQNAGSVNRLLDQYCGETSIDGYRFIVEDDHQGAFFRDQIKKGLQQTPCQASRLDCYIDWGFRIGRERVDAIVSNKHRTAYRRAACVLGALAEVYIARGDVEKAKAILVEYCKEKYNRYSAFRREVKNVLSGSALLRQFDGLV